MAGPLINLGGYLPIQNDPITGAAFDIAIPGHIVHQGALSPSLGALQTNITAQSFVSGSVDMCGSVSITTGATAPGIGAVIANVIFATPITYTQAPFIVVSCSSGQGVDFGVGSKTAAQFNINVGAIALVATTTYTIDYVVML